MSINETIIQAVTPIVPVCVPDVYRPDAGETPAEIYCVFNYTESPVVFGDDEPQAIRYLIQLHLYLPLGKTPLRLKRQLRRAMLDPVLRLVIMPTPASGGPALRSGVSGAGSGGGLMGFTVRGLDEFSLSLQELAELPNAVQDDMLEAGAAVVAKAQRDKVMAYGIYDRESTQHVADSIKPGKVKLKKGERVIYVSPRVSENGATQRPATRRFYSSMSSARRAKVPGLPCMTPTRPVRKPPRGQSLRFMTGG